MISSYCILIMVLCTKGTKLTLLSCLIPSHGYASYSLCFLCPLRPYCDAHPMCHPPLSRGWPGAAAGLCSRHQAQSSHPQESESCGTNPHQVHETLSCGTNPHQSAPKASPQHCSLLPDGHSHTQQKVGLVGDRCHSLGWTKSSSGHATRSIPQGREHLVISSARSAA